MVCEESQHSELEQSSLSAASRSRDDNVCVAVVDCLETLALHGT